MKLSKDRLKKVLSESSDYIWFVGLPIAMIAGLMYTDPNPQDIVQPVEDLLQSEPTIADTSVVRSRPGARDTVDTVYQITAANLNHRQR